MYLQSVKFFEQKIISPKVQNHALGELMAVLINSKNPENILVFHWKMGKNEKMVKNAHK